MNPFRSRVIGATSLATMAVVASAAYAAEPPPPKPEPSPVMNLPDRRAGTPADKFASEILALAEPRPGSGFASLAVDSNNNHLDLWWKGPIDSDIQQMIEAAEDAGVTVTVEKAVRSTQEMNQRMRGIIFHPRLREAGIFIQLISTPHDNSAIDIRYVSAIDPDEKRSAEAADRIIREETGGIPVRFARKVDKPINGLAGRQDDYPPWYGGGQIVSVRTERDQDEPG